MVRQPLVFLSVLLGGASMGLFYAPSPVLPVIAQRFGGGESGNLIAQLVLTSPNLGFMAGAWLSGWILERLGLRRVAALALAAFGLFGGATALAPDAWTLLASRLVIGFAAACLVTACIAFTAEIFDERARPRLIGFEVAAGGLTSVAGVFLAGLAASSIGWQAPFLFYPVLGLVGALLVLAVFPAQLSAQRRHDDGAPGSLRAVWPIYAMAVPLSTLSVIGVTQLPFLLAADEVGSGGTRAAILSAASLCTIAGSLSYGPLQNAFGRTPVFRGALLVGLIGLIDIGFAGGVVAYAAGAGLIGAAAGIFSPYLRDFTVVRAPPHLRARAIGQVDTATSFGIFAGPVIVAPLRSLFGLHGAFLAAAVVLFVTTALVLAVKPRLAARSA